METTYLSTTETAKLIRTALKNKFPAVKFSVRKDGSSVNIGWIDGPTTSDVDAIAKNYEGGRFDGMIDMAYSVESWLLPDGSAMVAKNPGSENSAGHHAAYSSPMPAGAKLVHFGARFVFTRREISPAVKAATLAKIFADFGVVAPEVTVEAYNDGGSYIKNDRHFPQFNEYSSTMVHRELCKVAL